MRIDKSLLKNICENPHDIESVKKLDRDLIDLMKWSNENIADETERKNFVCDQIYECLDILNSYDKKAN